MGVIVVLAAIPCFAAIALFSAGLAFNFQGFTFSGEKSVKVASGEIDADTQKVEIINKHGRVSITNQSDPKWNWELTTWADTKEEAELIEKTIELRITESDGGQVWELILPDELSGCNGFQSDLTLSVPASVEATITNRHGDVEVKEVEGGVTVANAHGHVNCESISSTADIENRHGDIHLTQFAGAKISNAHGVTNLSNGKGDVEVDSQHGNVTLKNVRGTIDLDCAFADIKSLAIDGNVTIDNQHGDIVLDCFGEKIKCRNKHGDCEIVVNSTSVKSIDVTNSHGDIDLSLPDSLNPKISATASHGDVQSEFSDSTDGDITVNLKTSFDDIRVTKHTLAVSTKASQELE